MKVLLVGSGQMAYEYWRVLDALGCQVIVAGRGLNSAKLFHEKTGVMPLLKPLREIINSEAVNFGIVATSVENLASVCIELLQLKVKNILLEKPGALYKKDLNDIQSLSNQCNANVLIAYNRRFYDSVLQAKEIIRQDGGILSAIFDFTEWSHQIVDLPIGDEVKQRWFLANSSHIVDLVWHLIGSPKELVSSVSGSLPWHESGSIFVGSGISELDIPFSYHANWGGPGRWLCEFVTKNHKLIFKPLESLSVIKLGSVNIEKFPTGVEDSKYKLGLFLQVKKFLGKDLSDMCSIDDQVIQFEFFSKISNYR